jgi:hypothetical protein
VKSPRHHSEQALNGIAGLEIITVWFTPIIMPAPAAILDSIKLSRYLFQSVFIDQNQAGIRIQITSGTRTFRMFQMPIETSMHNKNLSVLNVTCAFDRSCQCKHHEYRNNNWPEPQTT